MAGLILLNINKFLKEIHLKKQYFKKIQNKVCALTQLKEKNYKKLNSQLFMKPTFFQSTAFVLYVVEILFLKKNTFFHVSDFLGNLKFFYSAGFFKQKGKEKIARSLALRKFYRVLVSKLKFVKKFPIAIHFKNADFNMFWFLKKLKKKFFIPVVKHFVQYPYNGCKKKKIRRKKSKNKLLIL